jgi:hypothetical protein
LAGETEEPGENLPQFRFVHHKSHMTWPCFEPELPRWEAGEFRLSYVTAINICLLQEPLWITVPRSHKIACGIVNDVIVMSFKSQHATQFIQDVSSFVKIHSLTLS